MTLRCERILDLTSMCNWKRYLEFLMLYGFMRQSWNGSSNKSKKTYDSISKHNGGLLPFINHTKHLIKTYFIFLKMIVINYDTVYLLIYFACYTSWAWANSNWIIYGNTYMKDRQIGIQQFVDSWVEAFIVRKHWNYCIFFRLMFFNDIFDLVFLWII